MNQKREKFITLANKRVSKVLKQINLISNLSNTNNYEYTQDEVRQIIKALETSFHQCKESFSKKNQEDTQVFKLK